MNAKAVASVVAAFGLLLSHHSVANASTVFDAAADFSSLSNPNGSWQYGWSLSPGAAFTLDTLNTTVSGLNVWKGLPASDGFGNPSIQFNSTGSAISVSSVTWLPGHLAFHPGPAGENAVVRWIANSDERISVSAAFQGRDSVGTSTDVHVLRNGSALFDGQVRGFGATGGSSFARTLVVSAGDVIDFTVGRGANATYFNDTTQLDARITLVPEPSVVALFAAGVVLLIPAFFRRRRTLVKNHA